MDIMVRRVTIRAALAVQKLTFKRPRRTYLCFPFVIHLMDIVSLAVWMNIMVTNVLTYAVSIVSLAIFHFGPVMKRQVTVCLAV